MKELEEGFHHYKMLNPYELLEGFDCVAAAGSVVLPPRPNLLH